MKKWLVLTAILVLFGCAEDMHKDVDQGDDSLLEHQWVVTSYTPEKSYASSFDLPQFGQVCIYESRRDAPECEVCGYGANVMFSVSPLEWVEIYQIVVMGDAIPEKPWMAWREVSHYYCIPCLKEAFVHYMGQFKEIADK